MSPIPFFARHPRADLSAYIDEQLPPQRLAAVESHLAACPACRTEVEGLRATRDLLAALPQAEAPRSFALTPQMLGAGNSPEEARRPSRRGLAPAFFGMRIASAGLAVALALVFVADLGGGSSDSGGDDDSGDAAIIQMAATDTLSAADAAPEAQSDGADDTTERTAAPSELDVTRYVSPTPTLAAASTPAPGAGGPGGVGAAGETIAPTVEPLLTFSIAETPVTDPQVPNETPAPQPPDAVGAIPTAGADDTGDNRGVEEPTLELALDSVAGSALTDDNSDGLSALQIAEIVLAVTLAVAVAGGFLLPLALRRNR